MTDVLRILRVHNGWIATPGDLGGDIMDVNEPDRVMVATSVGDLMTAVAQWAADQVVVVSDIQSATQFPPMTGRYNPATGKYEENQEAGVAEVEFGVSVRGEVLKAEDETPFERDVKGELNKIEKTGFRSDEEEEATRQRLNVPLNDDEELPDDDDEPSPHWETPKKGKPKD